MHARKFLRSGLFLAMVFCVMSVDFLCAAEPATVESAAAVWNGLTWPVPKDVKEPQRQMAGLSYEADGDAQTAYDFQKKALVDAKWKEEPGAYLSKESCSGTYRKNGYALSLMTYGVKPGQANVSFTAHGNVELNKLPVPMGAKLLFAGPASTMYVTDAPPDKTAEAVTTLLAKQGWHPYGTAGDVRFFKLNAVQLSAFISTAPAQDNKTSITYSSQLMSADLTAPRGTLRLQYADTTKTLSFDTADSFVDVVKFYQTTLAKSGWKATHETLVKVDLYDTMIFRNPAKDMLTLELHEFEGKTRGLLKHESAAEVQAKYEREKAAAIKAANKKPTPSPTLAIKLPAKVKDLKVSDREIAFVVATGEARTAASEIAARLKKEGWKAGEQVAEPMAGTLLFSKDEQSITITYLDTGVLPAEVSITGIGVKLERAAEE